MPELPEVQTVVNYLSDNVLGKTISSIESPNNHAKSFVDGTLNDFPQAHQAYFFFSHFITKGDFWAMVASAIFLLSIDLNIDVSLMNESDHYR